MQEAKEKANQVNEPADLWALEHYLTQRRKEIDRKYDYRYSHSRTCSGDFRTKAASVRKICTAYVRTS
jgi:hypothetical protein